MPSWNIHIAHAEGLLSVGGPVGRMVRDRNAFLFGNLIPDIYVGYMVPAIAEPIPYRVTHFAVPEHIPKPREREFWDAYVAPLARALSMGGSAGAHVFSGDEIPADQVPADRAFDGGAGEAGVHSPVAGETGVHPLGSAGTGTCPSGWIVDAGSLAAEVEHVSPAHRAGYELRADPRDTARLQREAFDRASVLDARSVPAGAALSTSAPVGPALNTSVSDATSLNRSTLSTSRTFSGQNDPQNVRSLMKGCAAVDCWADGAADASADTQVGVLAGGVPLASMCRSLFDMVLGTWVHLLADTIWNQRVNDFLDARGEKPSSDFRIKKQSDFDQFGKSLHIDAVPLATPRLVELAARFPQYEIDERSVYATVAVAHEVVRTNTLFSEPAYRLLTREFFDQTFNEVQHEADRRFAERMRGDGFEHDAGKRL